MNVRTRGHSTPDQNMMHCTGQYARFEHWIKQQCVDYSAGLDAADTAAADDAILPSKLFRWVSLLQAFSTLVSAVQLGQIYFSKAPYLLS